MRVAVRDIRTGVADIVVGRVEGIAVRLGQYVSFRVVVVEYTELLRSWAWVAGLTNPDVLSPDVMVAIGAAKDIASTITERKTNT